MLNFIFYIHVLLILVVNFYVLSLIIHSGCNVVPSQLLLQVKGLDNFFGATGEVRNVTGQNFVFIWDRLEPGVGYWIGDDSDDIFMGTPYISIFFDFDYMDQNAIDHALCTMFVVIYEMFSSYTTKNTTFYLDFQADQINCYYDFMLTSPHFEPDYLSWRTTHLATQVHSRYSTKEIPVFLMYDNSPFYYDYTDFYSLLHQILIYLCFKTELYSLVPIVDRGLFNFYHNFFKFSNLYFISLNNFNFYFRQNVLYYFDIKTIFDINYIFFSLDFSFLSFIFMFLTFIVFFILWFYAFCVGISLLEVFIYFFIEILSFLVFFVDSLFYFIILLEVTTILLLFTYSGERDRRYRAMSLLFYYTLVSGLFLLLVFMVRETGCFLTEFDAGIVFILMVVGVFIKLPIYPFHLWLPEAHAEATTCSSVILAGVILKMGFYGFVNFVSSDILYSNYKNFIVYLLLFSSFFLLCAIYVQVDIKKIIAYSSVIHMQIALAVFLMDSLYGYEASILIVINHGLVSVGLFIIASLYISNEGTRDIIKWSFSSGYLSKLFLFFVLSNMSFPFTIGFWGELLGVYSSISLSSLALFFFIINQLIVIIYNLRFYWLVLSVTGPYYRLRGLINYKVTIILFIILFYNFILFFSVLSFLN